MALQDRKVDSDREWITVQGKKMLWYIFIYEFDGRDFRNKISHITGERRNAVFSAASLIQEMINEYTKGADDIGVFKSWLEEADLVMPADTRLQQAIEKLFSQLEQKYGLNLSDLLDHAVWNSEYEFERLLPERNAIVSRQKMVSEILEGYTGSVDSPFDIIRMLLYVEEHKKADIDSNQKSNAEKEQKALLLWISILARSVYSKYITHGQMLSLVQDRFLDESDISDLLEKYGDKRDYEWYSEDFLGSNLSDKTILLIDDILAFAEPKFKDILGFGQNHT